MLRRLEQNRQAAKRAYNKRIAKQTSDADKIRESEHELKQLRLVVEQQQHQIKVLNAVVGLMKDNSPLELRELLKKHEEEGKLNDSGHTVTFRAVAWGAASARDGAAAGLAPGSSEE